MSKWRSNDERVSVLTSPSPDPGNMLIVTVLCTDDKGLVQKQERITHNEEEALDWATEWYIKKYNAYPEWKEVK